jgi:AcrR family transcriptional regulator
VDGLVVDVVLRALARDGYAGLRIDDVAAEAGVAKTTVYRRWPTKEALVAAAVSQLYLDRVSAVDHGDLRSDLLVLLRGTCEVLFRGSGRVLEDLVRESGRSRELAEVVRATNEARRRAFHLAMNRAVARGALDASIDHELLVDLLVGPLWTRLLITGGLVVEGDLEAIVDAVLSGVLVRPA